MVEMMIREDIARQFEKIPPHSIEAEKCLIGSMLLLDGDRAAFASIRGTVSRDSFYQADHQVIWDVICWMRDGDKSIDGTTVRDALKARGTYEEVGGTEYLAEILNAVPSAAHYAHYAEIIHGAFMLRQGIVIANDLLRACYKPCHSYRESADEHLSAIATKASKIIQNGKAMEVHTLGDAIGEVMARARTTEASAALRIPTRIRSIDDLIGGLRRGSKTIIGGKPGMGKSALLKQLLRNIAGAGVSVGLITVEESRFKVAENALSSESQVRNNRIAFGTATPEEWNEVELAVDRLSGLPYYIVDSARKLSQIISLASVLANQYGCQVIGVDHLHIIEGNGHDNREREMSNISGALKWCWKDLNVAGIEAAQLNRASGKEMPSLSSLRDSGSLEQDGDVVILLHREDYYRKQDKGNTAELDETLEVNIAKNKDGATAVIPVHFDESLQIIEDFGGANSPIRPVPEGIF